MKMETVTLKRVAYNEFATLGTLIYKDVVIACTLELPWKENQRQISSIPAGSYLVNKYSSHRFPDTFRLYDVPNRSDILIHPGNFTYDTRGCILAGSQLSGLTLINSRDTFIKLNKILPSTFTLLIKDT